MMIWTTWWVWLAAALVLAIVEVLVPAFVFLGFAIGAAVTGALMFFGIFDGSLPKVLVVFAVVSLIAWIALRLIIGIRKGQVKTFEHDINK